jgi:hypothetical protein
VLSRRGFSPAAIVLLLITAIVGGGVEIRPVPASGCSIATDDHVPDPQPREESPEETAEDEESASAKHAVLGSTVALEWPACRGRRLCDSPDLLAAGRRLGAAPIRGPPSQA